ncbi:MAG: DeoR/GlpR transcriptional regulator [Akkermansiaceae bacterium]|nr:DeoR/GlpR transcriptional regulator [Akkermansiaceae bacterium]
MLAAERQRRILELARRDGTVRTTDLAKSFEVTEETIRRDLDLLGRRGHLKRTHGGAMDATAPLAEPSHSQRQARQLDEKIAIAKEAAKFLISGETILLDASSTALELASQLPTGLPLRIVTYSLAVVERLSSHEGIDLIQLGGSFDARGRRFSGLLTESALRSLRIDRFFFSGGGLDPDKGISEPNPEQARLKRLMLKHSGWNCGLIDHSKLGMHTDFYFASLDELDAIVMDREARNFSKSQLKNVSCVLRFSR